MLVKKALIDEGFDKRGVRVGHGRGTSLCWLEVQASCRKGAYWQKEYDLALAIAQRVTGRHGDYSGEISVTMDKVSWGWLKEEVGNV